MQRSFTIDVLKVFAAQLIVWHHLSAYGPIAGAIETQWPMLIDRVYHDARLAVQVFLVIAGYLAAQALANRPITHLGSSLFKRYVRLAPPFIAALLWVMATVALARPFVHADWLPEAPHLLQFVAHALFLNQLLDMPALSSGVWYVAIDFQLYALMALMAFGIRRVTFWRRSFAPKALSLGVLLLCTLSLYWFNLDDAWDNWAIYFFGAYGLGALAAWSKRSRFDAAVFALAMGLAVVSLVIAFRTRLCLAMLTATVLALKLQTQTQRGQWRGYIHRLANGSYAQFLTHFGVIVLFNTLWTIEHFAHPVLALCFALLAWLCSIAIGLLFHERVETTLQQWGHQQTKLSFWRATN